MKNFSTFAKTFALAFAFFMAGHFAYANCKNIMVLNKDPDCETKFLSITADNCTVDYYSVHTVTIQVNQSGGSFNFFPEGGTTIYSTQISGTTITCKITRTFPTSGNSIGLAVHAAENGANTQNFVHIAID